MLSRDGRFHRLDHLGQVWPTVSVTLLDGYPQMVQLGRDLEATLAGAAADVVAGTAGSGPASLAIANAATEASSSELVSRIVERTSAAQSSGPEAGAASGGGSPSDELAESVSEIKSALDVAPIDAAAADSGQSPGDLGDAQVTQLVIERARQLRSMIELGSNGQGVSEPAEVNGLPGCNPSFFFCACIRD